MLIYSGNPNTYFKALYAIVITLSTKSRNSPLPLLEQHPTNFPLQGPCLPCALYQIKVSFRACNTGRQLIQYFSTGMFLVVENKPFVSHYIYVSVILNFLPFFNSFFPHSVTFSQAL